MDVMVLTSVRRTSCPGDGIVPDDDSLRRQETGERSGGADGGHGGAGGLDEIGRSTFLAFGVDDHDAEAFGAVDQFLGDAAMAEQALPPGDRARAADHDLADAVFLGELQDRGGDVLAFDRQDHRAQLIGQRERVGQQALGDGVDIGGAFGRGLDIDGVPVAIEPAGQSGCEAEEAGAVGAAGGETDHDLIGRAIGGGGDFLLRGLAALEVDLAGQFAQGQFAQMFEVGIGEEIFQGGLHALGGIDLALAQALLEVFGGQVDVDDLIGFGQDRIGNVARGPSRRRVARRCCRGFRDAGCLGRR